MADTTDATTVTLAIAHLDRVAPAGWRERVDLDELNLMSLTSCVLGQIYREYPGDYCGYNHGLNHLGHPSTWGYDDAVYASPSYLDEWKRQLGGGG